MNVITTCPGCKRSNDLHGIVVEIEGERVRICKACAAGRDELTENKYLETKARREKERKEQNAKIIRQLRTNTYPKWPGSR